MKGIFCLEGFWYGDHRDKTSVFPILDLANRNIGLPYLYHRCGTIEEFKFSIQRWKRKDFHNKYPLLYLGFHGEIGKIHIGNDSITIDELAEMLGDKCEKVVIYFGSCETMNIDKRLLLGFMEKTKSLAMLGYKKEVDWLQSASFDILLLHHLFRNPFDSVGIKKTKEQIMKEAGKQALNLEFRMELNERIHFKRTRK